MRFPAFGVSLGLLCVAGPVAAAPILMSAEWAKAACEAWNQDAVLTGKLVESGWVKNDNGRGYKIMQIYRSDCGQAATTEMRVSLKEGKAMCIYGGAPMAGAVNTGADYVMKAETPRWVEMGKGEYGPMKAMMFGRLGFDGPMMEAMGNMQPFESFLLLVGKVESDTASCPAK